MDREEEYEKWSPNIFFPVPENLEPWKLAKVFEAGRFHGISRMDFLRSVTTRRYGYFVIGLHYEFNPDIWSVRRGLCFPFKVSVLCG